MPSYDFKCQECGDEREYFSVRIGSAPPCAACGGPTSKFWSSRFPNVIGDEIDETIENLTVQPQHFSSRSEKRQFLALHGFKEKVRHMGTPGEGSDKSPHTVNWAAGLPAGVDGRPMSMLSPEEQEQRRREWMAL